MRWSRFRRTPVGETSRRVEVEAPAKVNLWLHVLERMESGYHALETLFCAVSLTDTIRLWKAEPGVRLRVSGGDDLGPPERNLVVRAAKRFLSATDRREGVEIELVKRIPAAAGLGGGSSDAGAVLRGMNLLFGHPLDRGELLHLALELGSDVPFFLASSPFAVGWGRGERLLSLPTLPPRPVLIAHPGTAMPTAEAFARLAASRAGAPHSAPAHFELGDLSSWERIATLAHNDFQDFAVAAIPILVNAIRAMRESGAGPALLSGSGASVFGVFPAADLRDAAAASLNQLGLRTWSAETLPSFPAPQVDPSPGGG